MSERIDLDELARLARKALYGLPKRYFAGDADVFFVTTVDGRDSSVPQSYAYALRVVDAQHIAAANPATTVALIERIRELEAALRIAERYVCTTEDDHLVNGVLEKGAVRRG